MTAEVHLPTEAATKERFHALDSVRAAAMLLGIFLHAAISFATVSSGEWFIRDVHTRRVYDLLIVFIHTFRMPLFFLMAGFFGHLLYHRVGPAAFFKHRVKRIFVPFVVGMVVIVPLVRAVWVYGQIASIPAETRPSVGPAIVHHFLSGDFLDHYNAAHLWFLYYLLIFYGLAMIGVVAARRLVGGGLLENIDKTYRWLLKSSIWKPLVFAFLTLPTLYLMRFWGVDTPRTLVPEAKFLFAYGVFFLSGWLLHRQPELLSDFKRNVWVYLFIAVALLLPIHVLLLRFYPQVDHSRYGLLKFSALLTNALITWLMVFSVTGLFVRYMNRPSARMRYIADSSYWLYLIHLPLVGSLQILIAESPLPPFIKFLLILMISLPLMLISYHYCVRYTFIGAILNGRKYRENAVMNRNYRQASSSAG